MPSTRFLEDGPFFLLTMTASQGEKRLALIVSALSFIVFAVLAPFAKIQLAPVAAFIPAYETSLVVIDLTTVALLFGQFLSCRSRALLFLSSGYLFCALMTVAHALTFPGLFSESGLLDAGPQTTAWLYMFWHGGFPLFIFGYALQRKTGRSARQGSNHAIGWGLFSCLAVIAVVIGFTLLATVGHAILPDIMKGHGYTPAMIAVVSSVWMLSASALIVLFIRKPHSLLDLWLMVAMCAWLVDLALSAVLNHGRFDMGFYAGRIYGFMAASFVLLVLLVESGILYRKLIQLTAQLRRLTLEDALTGVANRRAFDTTLDLEWRRAVRSGLPLSLLMLDVDQFKSFNDNYGHVAGDNCLQTVARTVRSKVTRTTDLVSRYGGEEFAVLLPETDLKAAGLLAERIRTAVAELAIPNQASPFGVVTVSIGVAETKPDQTHDYLIQAGKEQPIAGQQLVRIADALLYTAKSSGRNRVISAQGNDGAGDMPAH